MIIDHSDIECMLAWSLDKAPREACGLLICDPGEVRIMRASCTRNVANSTSSFELHPRDVYEAEMFAEAKGWKIWAAWHSHPSGIAQPSINDIEQNNPFLTCVILALGIPPTITAWDTSTLPRPRRMSLYEAPR